MKKNIIFKILASFPIILLSLYFIPFLGVCLVIFRYFMYSDRKRITTPIIIAIIGLLVLLPNIVYSILKLLKFDINRIPYFEDIVKSELYSINFVDYGKFLICLGVLSLIIVFVLKTIFDKLNTKLNHSIRNYVEEKQKMDYEISKQNDMEIKLRQEQAKNTSYVKCPKCGSDNILSDKFGTCKYCRSKLQNKSYK